MILELHNSIELNLDTNNLTEHKLNQLSALFRLRRKGVTFILVKISLLEKLLKLPFSPHDISNIRMLLKDQTQWSNWLKKLDFRIVLTTLNDAKNSDLTTQGNFPHIHLNEFNDCPPTIIAENIHDVKFFKYMANSYFKDEIRLRGVKVTANEKLGGGATINQVIQTHQENNEGIAFCIVDSDKKHPTCTFGETAMGVKALQLSNLTTTVFTESREVENLIPFSLMYEIFESKHQRLKIDEYKKLREIKVSGHNPIKYIDFKKGLRKHVATKGVCEVTKVFWSDVLQELGMVCDCNCDSAKKCTCIVIDGFGSDLLKTIVDKLKTTDFKISEIEEHYKDELFALCKKMMPYVIAPIETIV